MISERPLKSLSAELIHWPSRPSTLGDAGSLGDCGRDMDRSCSTCCSRASAQHLTSVHAGRKARDQTNFGLIPARTHDSEDHGKASQAKCTSSTPDEQCATMPPSGVRPVTTCTQHGMP